MVQEKLNSLRPYVTGIRFVKNLPVVDLILQDNWDIFESDNVTYKISNTNTNYFMVFPKNPDDSIDVVLHHVEQVIEVNVEKLKFTIESIPEPTLNDIPTTPTNGTIKKNGVELPPPKSSKYSLEKEEVN